MSFFANRTWKDIPYETIPKGLWPARILWHAQRLMDEAKDARRAQRKAGLPVTIELVHPDLAYHRACRLIQDEALGKQTLPLGSGIA